MLNTEKTVEVTCLLELVIGLVDRVEEVGQDYKDQDTSAVLNKSHRSWRWFGVAGAYEHRIQRCLEIPCDQVGEKVPAGKRKQIVGHVWDDRRVKCIVL